VILVEWLQATRERLVTKGWTRGLGPGDGSRCLFMSLEDTCRDDRTWNTLIGKALIELKSTIGLDDKAAIVDWNDAQPSVEPVLDVLDKTIARLTQSSTVGSNF
jgi:hypothetical protein